MQLIEPIENNEQGLSVREKINALIANNNASNYSEGTATFELLPMVFEAKTINGINVTASWDIQANDDQVLSAEIDAGGIISIGLQGSLAFNNLTASLSAEFEARFINTLTNTQRTVAISKLAKAVSPQWKGQKADGSSLNNTSYSVLSNAFTKVIQNGWATSIEVTPGNYGVFLSINPNAEIREEGTGFLLSPSAYEKNSIWLEHEDGTDFNITEYIIPPANGTFSYNLE